ncbi:hypothetical protein FRB90_004847 [Tulasnella sp. 427]|nr:hypothetical protein FRB90_004847 [Tulasnella sp. 427]
MPTTIVLTEPFLKTQCELGEGPLWDPRTQTLHFIDIFDPHLYHYEFNSGKLDVQEFPEPIGCLALRKGGGLACAAKRGFGVLEPQSRPTTIKYLNEPFKETELPYIRFNDGACDPNGVFWAGTLEYTTKEGKHFPGGLWKFDPRENAATVVDTRDITDSNAIGWSADHKTMFFVNSTVNLIYAYDYDVERGTASNRRIFVDGETIGLPKKVYGNPDGFCIDREGCIWSARWEGSRIVRLTPDGKGIDLEVHIPKAYNVTACCFGGPDMDKLFITTASCHANQYYDSVKNVANQEKYPLSGDVFMLDLGTLDKAVIDEHKGAPLYPDVANAEMVQSKESKKKVADFSKPKVKLGKGKLSAANSTDTSFKSRSIALPTQRIAVEKEHDLPTTRRNLALDQLLIQTKHYSAAVRKDSVLGLKELLVNYPHLLKVNLNVIVGATARNITDEDTIVRDVTYGLYSHIFSVLPEARNHRKLEFFALINI